MKYLIKVWKLFKKVFLLQRNILKDEFMTRILFIVIALVALTNVMESFIGCPNIETLFGIKVNYWVYRLFWSLIFFCIIYDYFRSKKNEP